jgi:release factor glutamine methyltransferase
MIPAGLTPASARRRIADQLARQGSDEAAIDARLLVRLACGIDPALPGSAADTPLSSTDTERLGELVARRIAHEPIARIMGSREFRGLDFALNAACLVPRPDTETLVDVAFDLLPSHRPARILDLGTGPGTLLLAILSERPDARGIGIDCSPLAIEAARGNALSLGLAARATFHVGDWASGLADAFDLIVSNPPYIPSGVCETLAPEVRDHDPRLALDGGSDGLDCYRTILRQAPALLAPDGHVLLELGIGQAGSVATIARHHGLMVAGLRSDLGGIPRALTLRMGS